MSANVFDPQKRPAASKESQNQYAPEEKGSITNTLGTGENAKNSLIYITIKWCFIAAAVLSAVVVGNAWIFRQPEHPPLIIDDVFKVWGLFIPIVTLALGYAFGKSQRGRGNSN